MIFIKIIWRFRKTFLHFVFDPSPETLDIRFKYSVILCALFFPIFFLLFLEVFKKVRLDFEFNGVVSGRDCIYVVFYIFVLLQTLYVVDIVDDKEGNEDCCTCYDKTLLLAYSYLLRRQLTSNLDEELRVGRTALFVIETRLCCVDERVEFLCDCTRRLPNAVLIQPSFNFFCV